MATTLVIETDCIRKGMDDSLTIYALQRDNVWTPIVQIPVTEEMVNSYMFPLLLKIP